MNQKNWTNTTIGEICLVGDGAHAKINRQESGILYLTSRNFKNGKLELSKVDYISENDYKKYFRADSKALTKPHKEDIVFSIIGTIGEPYLYTEKDFFGISSAVSILRPDKFKIDPKYLFYWIKGYIFQNALYAIKGGVAQSYVSLEMIKSLPLNYPTKAIQRKIAGILSAYDDLIENNTRRIEILEEMARMLYREWFVKFRFPVDGGNGGEGEGDRPSNNHPVELVESELGLIPKGWEVVTLKDYVKLTHGYAFKSSQFSTEPTPYVVIRMGNITENGGLQVEKNIKYVEHDSFKEKYLLKPNDLVMAFSDVTRAGGIIGNVALIPNDENQYVLNQRVVKIDVPENLKMFFYIYFNSQTFKDHCLSRADSATVLNLKNDHIYDHQVLIPSQSILSRFIENITQIVKQIQILEKKNINLRKTRDLLLPRLISGEIDLEELDINLGAMND